MVPEEDPMQGKRIFVVSLKGKTLQVFKTPNGEDVHSLVIFDARMLVCLRLTASSSIPSYTYSVMALHGY